MDFEFKTRYNIEDMQQIMRILRSENGCPWDKEQDHHSIRKDFIEEVYEAVEAIDLEDTELLREELGDVLLQVIFHSRIEEEKGTFTFGDVVNEVCQKLVIRHPHVFGDVNVNNSEDVLKNWNNIKQETKGQTTYTETLESVCTALPSLMRAQKLCSRAKRAGFAFETTTQAAKKLEELVKEIVKLSDSGVKPDKEIGSLLFAAAELSELYKIDAEEALTRTCEEFTGCFKRVEELTGFNGIDMKSLNINELEAYWLKAKEMSQ